METWGGRKGFWEEHRGWGGGERERERERESTHTDRDRDNKPLQEAAPLNKLSPLKLKAGNTRGLISQDRKSGTKINMELLLPANTRQNREKNKLTNPTPPLL